MQLDVAGFEDGADLDGKWFAAGITLVDADPGALALQRAAFVHDAAMQAETPIAPHMRLHEGVGVFLAMVLGSDRTDIDYLLGDLI
jgi:hypothetical protein